MTAQWTHALHDYRAARIANYLLEFIQPGDTVLDCGCGDMTVARSISERSSVDIVGIDIVSPNRTNTKMCICDGKSLCFSDDSFNVVILSFVLHHTQYKQKVLKECLRVTKRRLIILEDIYRSQVELLALKISDWIGNRPFSSEMSIPFNFDSTHGWLALFREIGASTTSFESIRPLPWLPTRQRMFAIEQSLSEIGDQESVPPGQS